MPDRLQLIMMTFGAVTFSLLLQGLTISTLLKMLGVTTRRVALRKFWTAAYAHSYLT